MKQDQSYFRQVFYLREDNLVWIVKRTLLWELLIKLLHYLPKITLHSLSQSDSETFEMGTCRQHELFINLHRLAIINTYWFKMENWLGIPTICLWFNVVSVAIVLLIDIYRKYLLFKFIQLLILNYQKTLIFYQR